jgi:hypothetical protein
MRPLAKDGSKIFWRAVISFPISLFIKVETLPVLDEMQRIKSPKT